MGAISSVLADVEGAKPLGSMLDVAKAHKAREQQPQPQAAAGLNWSDMNSARPDT